ncbi:hypothetical protein RhiirA5_505435 [Rhizophagus irregularis]|uniref:K Homology domain-containing protein n=2 Tax=Rhizophagus irregularis TaxID=588596 RepID=A0A2N0NZJ7_9GLOM|nr:hypothetical protein GLOIN_2v1562839 [Rhizophagus irregularis DAOM 181602=DAOM 197198]PKB99976.1 hypothetical protein RhiirA5_505435 [Rhizophagus irregularis]POG75688.1 hypothetical protein GLOIN_2v1562839 [Rhizophagus irregularis DAOM 181602=DAOM 197198]UZO23154.1 hypothetical protein OCT59_015498 [Rhizophagus irregularis]CAB4463681.1 unnamed protein product [Rhizophagus irregularis]CAB5370456.1 unnamed protein product [Rhizophagus irregularis]|eukprot:XP_025182554.1 hypothetical protein GLOIN_2v1562839 [Rhizophagus irregularis DAOM 181602=DAOM 197198]
MENQSPFKVYTAIETTNLVDIGKLIGHKGCNLKPIATRTGTNIHVDKKENEELVIIKIQVKVENDSSDKRIKEASYQMMQLVEDLTKKEEKKVRFSDDDNHQHVPPRTPPRNQRDFDSKERRNNFNQETSYATNSRQPRNRYYD